MMSRDPSERPTASQVHPKRTIADILAAAAAAAAAAASRWSRAIEINARGAGGAGAARHFARRLPSKVSLDV